MRVLTATHELAARVRQLAAGAGRAVGVLALAGVPLAAHASDFSGMAAFIIGLPALGIGVLVAAVFFAFPAGRGQKIAAAVLLVPALAVGALLIPDVLSLQRYDDQTGTIVLYFGLLIALAALLVGLMVRRPTPPES